MEKIVLVYFLFRGLSIILEKYDLYEKFKKYSMNKGVFLYKVSKCQFCMDHHLSIISTLVIGVLLGFEWFFLILPIVSASIHNMKNDRSKY